MILRWSTLLAMLLSSFGCMASICHNVNNTISVVNYDLTSTLTTEQNQVGQATELHKSQFVNVDAICPEPDPTNVDSRTYRSYITSFPVVETHGQWQYLTLDPDYVNGAMSITDTDAGVFYPPGNYIHMGRNTRVNKQKDFGVYDSNLTFRLKVVKPFIGSVVIPSRTMFSVYVTTNDHDPLSTIVYQITYSGIITVPQNCTINGGQIITVDLGKLNSAAFNEAGKKPYNAPEKTFNVPIACNGDVVAPAHLTLRMQATPDSHIADAVATDNPDVGVVVTSENGSVLKPNDINSSVDFTTSEDGSANITLKTYPVSTTGNTPAEGIFTALACLRVDFA